MYITMQATIANPEGVLINSLCYDLPKTLALKVLSKKLAGSDLPAAVIETDPMRIQKARRGMEIPVQAAASGEVDWEDNA